MGRESQADIQIDKLANIDADLRSEVHQQITCRGFDQLCYFPVEGEDMQRLKTQGHYLGKFLGWHGSPQ